ncbi:MAG: TatD family hydrolase [Eubacteriales bacterium]|nr:TatD family hydrolase [Eubacteriales bacterium]
MIFDTHAHYDDRAFDTDREELLASLPEKGVGRVVNIAADLQSVSSSLALAERYPYLYAALGVHPSGVSELTEESYFWLEERLSHPKAVAVGEIGLDYYWEKEEPVQALQREHFSRQLELAKRLDKPVVIHSRDAARDTLEVMAAAGGGSLRAVIHCFSYTKETAREFLRWDYYFGVGGVLTFKNGRKLREAVAEIPMERILLETDCPYLAPEPYRGKRNCSLYLAGVADALAQLKGISRREVEEITWRNAQRFYGLE